MSIAQEHLDFVLRTGKRITYTTYWSYRIDKKTDDEIELLQIKWGGGRKRYKNSITELYQQAVEKGYKNSFSTFYKYRQHYIFNDKLIWVAKN